MAKVNGRDAAASISVPTLILSGEDDVATTPAGIAALAAAKAGVDTLMRTFGKSRRAAAEPDRVAAALIAGRGEYILGIRASRIQRFDGLAGYDVLRTERRRGTTPSWSSHAFTN